MLFPLLINMALFEIVCPENRRKGENWSLWKLMIIMWINNRHRVDKRAHETLFVGTNKLFWTFVKLMSGFSPTIGALNGIECIVVERCQQYRYEFRPDELEETDDWAKFQVVSREAVWVRAYCSTCGDRRLPPVSDCHSGARASLVERKCRTFSLQSSLEPLILEDKYSAFDGRVSREALVISTPPSIRFSQQYIRIH